MKLLQLTFIIALCNCEAKQCCSNTTDFLADIGKCAGNGYVDLKCDGVYVPLNVTELEDVGMILLNNGSLINQEGTITEYCITTIHIVDVNYDGFIICYMPDTTFVSEENKIKVVAILGYCSLVFIISTIAIYCLIPILLDLQGICIVHCLTGQAFGHIFLGILQLTYLDNVVCEAFALITYAAFIYMFFWLTVLSFHIWKTTIEPAFCFEITNWKLVYYCFAIGGTTFLLTILLLSHYSDWSIFDGIKPGIGETSCWFISMRETFIYFYIPISILLITNIICYVWTITVLSRRIINIRSKLLNYRLKICVRLCIIMGITWVFEIITALLKNRVHFVGKVLIYILDILNVLQGFLIFLILVVFRKKVRRALANSNPCNITFPRSWKNLNDEETEYEDNTSIPIVEYRHQ